jgi:hypothetical protein
MVHLMQRPATKQAPNLQVSLSMVEVVVLLERPHATMLAALRPVAA